VIITYNTPHDGRIAEVKGALKVAYHLLRGLEIGLRGMRLGGAENAQGKIHI
jgi:hypothetical protein